MAKFPAMILTEQGELLYNKVQAGVPLLFTKMKVGAGWLKDGQDQEKLTGLIDYKYDVKISSITQNSELKVALISGSRSNADITEGTYICELGLCARDPDIGEILYGYTNAGELGDHFAPVGPDGSGGMSWSYQISTAIGNTANVEVVVSSNTFDHAIAISDAQFEVISGSNQKEINESIDATFTNLKTELISKIGVPEGELTVYSATGANYYDRGVFRFKFYRTGDDAVTGANQEVPDYVYDVSSAYVVAYYAYTELLKLRSPFLSPATRFVSKPIEYIRVRLTRENGTTSLAYRQPEKDTDGRYYVPIAQSIPDSPSVQTPAHELMHIFQYGYSMFGGGWYLEGMARAAQDIFAVQEDVTNAGTYVKRDKRDILDLLENPTRFAELTAKSYTAANFFWHPLFELSPGTQLKRSDPYFQVKLLTTGDHICSDWLMTLPEGLDRFFQYLEEETDRCYKEMGYTSWTTAALSAAINNRYITRALKRYIKEAV